ncbi:hypothetical protein BC830DRAFT_950097 [Chytriomyces sp. MP71]|nr:hypothetical protein BC830DRAFT_950097 [Chytriomyces sp. MP71]
MLDGSGETHVCTARTAQRKPRTAKHVRIQLEPVPAHILLKALRRHPSSAAPPTTTNAQASGRNPLRPFDASPAPFTRVLPAAGTALSAQRLSAPVASSPSEAVAAKGAGAAVSNQTSGTGAGQSSHPRGENSSSAPIPPQLAVVEPAGSSPIPASYRPLIGMVRFPVEPKRSHSSETASSSASEPPSTRSPKRQPGRMPASRPATKAALLPPKLVFKFNPDDPVWIPAVILPFKNAPTLHVTIKNSNGAPLQIDMRKHASGPLFWPARVVQCFPSAASVPDGHSVWPAPVVLEEVNQVFMALSHFRDAPMASVGPVVQVELFEIPGFVLYLLEAEVSKWESVDVPAVFEKYLRSLNAYRR